MRKGQTTKKNLESGMTLLEVLVGFVIFSASLVAVLDYVSNQIYLSHLTEKNQHKASLIYEYAALSNLGEQAQLAFIGAQQEMNIMVNSVPLYEIKERNKEMALLKTDISVSDQGNSYQWSILEIK